jgi:hypothetical protein
VHTALIEDDALYTRTVDAWCGVPHAVTHESLTSLSANGWYRTRARAEQVMSDPAPFVTLDYDCPTPSLHARWEARATRDGTAHGLLLWFDTVLVPGITLSNSPSAPPAFYGQAFFPFMPAFTMRRGDRLYIEMRTVLAGDDYAWSWMADDDAGRAVRHTTLRALPLDPTALAVRSDHFAPRRSEEAEIICTLLDAADGVRTFGELAQLLFVRFPERFATVQGALDYAARLEDMWAR